ncbi:MAG: hypothetical protein KC656_25855, partial [Myxococcales bacterium]|nr:hypothetical protein [Myxococcales bacterium]
APLNVYWSPDNRPTYGDESLGEIGTSFWRASEGSIYLLGAEDIDTDEYDTHVVFHEWTHSFQSRESRSDSLGGAHPAGSILDPRVAHGEGTATAVAALVYDDRPYIDTRDPDQQGGFFKDVEGGSASGGWWNEYAVQAVIYDLYDTADEPGIDTVSLPMADLWERMVQDEAVTPAFTSVFSLVDAVKDAHPTQAAAIDTICAAESITGPTDPYGTGETHDNGLPANLPVHRLLTPNGPTSSLSFAGNQPSNRLSRNRFVRFTGTGGSLSLHASSDRDVDIRLYRDGDFLSQAYNGCSNPPCTETVTVSTVAGATYVAVVEGYSSNPSYTATTWLTPKSGAPATVLGVPGPGSTSLDVRFDGAGEDVEVRVWCASGLETPGWTGRLPAVYAGVAITLDVPHTGSGDLAVSVRGTFGGETVDVVQSVTVGHRPLTPVPRLAGRAKGWTATRR